MGHLAVWKVLDEMIMEFRQRGLIVPSDVMNDLKSALSMIKIGEADIGRGETAPKIEEYLNNVESHLIAEGQRKFEPKYIEEWLRRLDEASYETCATLETCETEAPPESRFIIGVPREQKWLRIEPKDELTFEKLQKLAEQTGVSTRAEEDGHLVAHGKAEAMKEFIKKMTEFESQRRRSS